MNVKIKQTAHVMQREKSHAESSQFNASESINVANHDANKEYNDNEPITAMSPTNLQNSKCNNTHIHAYEDQQAKIPTNTNPFNILRDLNKDSKAERQMLPETCSLAETVRELFINGSPVASNDRIFFNQNSS